MSTHRGLLQCGVGATLATVLVGCAAAAPHGAPAMPFVTNGATAGKPGSGPRFLHEYKLPMGTFPSSIIAGPDGADHNLWFTEIQSQTDITKIGVLKP